MKSWLLLFLLVPGIITTRLCQAQNPILWGMSSSGGANDSGAIFSYNSSSITETVVHSFGNDSDGSIPYGSPIQASNGLLYGMNYEGGKFGVGTMFSYNISTGTKTILHDFGNDSDGFAPVGSFIRVGDSLLYGVTFAGGVDSGGTIFSYNIFTNSYNVLYDFDIDSDQSNPNGPLLQANNGMLYGTTLDGGKYFAGTIFSYNVSTGKEVVLYVFDGRDTDGLMPESSLIQASNGLLYGMTWQGGADVLGTIFSYNISTGILNNVHDFGGSYNDGYQPYGSLLQVGDSLLYGLTSSGGLNNDPGGSGVIFDYNIYTGKETDLHNFGSGTDGKNPYASLIQANNGLLYGTTAQGGVGSAGIIFSYNISNGEENDVYNFTSSEGANPYGNLIEVDTPTTGINHLSAIKNQLLIYPNPTSGQFTIKTNGNQNGYKVEVYNLLGEEIYETVLSNSQNTINLNSQPAGLYFVYLKSDEGVKVGKVLVAK